MAGATLVLLGTVKLVAPEELVDMVWQLPIHHITRWLQLEVLHCSTMEKDSGTCYQVVCLENPACSRRPIRVTITDECPGGPCASEPAHFDLSGKAIGALAIHGQADQLRAAGVLRVVYRRVPCTFRESSYSSPTIGLHVDAGANPYYMAFVVEYQEGYGDLASVEIQPAGGSFIPMQQMRSAVWKVNSGSALTGPFNVRLTSGESGKVIVAQAVIPVDWSADATYRSMVNF
ncbi:hypothetical protein Bca4012_060252 [Brassica carinata]